MKLHRLLKRPEWLALVLGLVFGACNLILTPPFQAPDEDNRFFRSYHIADGHFLGEKTNQRVGGTIPVSLVETAETFRYLRAQPHSKTTAEQIKAGFNVELLPENKAFHDFPNSAIYPPVLFAPQALAIFLCKPFHLSPLALLYVARLACLLFWLCALFFAIRIVPFQKELFLLLGLLPMSTFMHASCSADVLPDALGFLSIAVVLRAIYRTGTLSKWELLGLAGFDVTNMPFVVRIWFIFLICVLVGVVVSLLTAPPEEHQPVDLSDIDFHTTTTFKVASGIAVAILIGLYAMFW